MDSTTLLGIIFIIVGALVLLVELNTLTIYLLAVAIAFFASGGLALAGGIIEADLVLLAVIIILAMPIVYWWRGKLKNRAAEQVTHDDDGQEVTISSIDPENIRVNYRGTNWNAKIEQTDNAKPPNVGESWVIVRRMGNLLIIDRRNNK